MGKEPFKGINPDECVAMGADETILISDRAVGGSDTQATSNALVATIKKAEEKIEKYRRAYNGHKISAKSYQYPFFKTSFYRALNNGK